MSNTAPDAKSIFGRVLEIASPSERAAYLQEACGGDDALRAEVEALLQAFDRAGPFLKLPGGAPDAFATRDADATPLAERLFGPYKLLQQIGEGGMGTVYMAEQEAPVRRKVALKVIKPGMDSGQVIARFEAERQALAMMDHINIAKVFDAGTTETGRPYFVMELVHGVPITKFCDDNQLTPRERLALFVPVCQAIQHAHQKGIIHRDIKPSNVLVTMYDDKPVPKVIDFGVAKAIEQRLTEKTLFTQFGALMGTFEYMSPEQAEMNAFGVDTRSDIYALGVLLYELLTGTTPLQRERLRQAALDEVVHIIKTEEPPRPSVRLSSSNSLPKIAAARKTEPAKLSKLVRGEIDWIVMKCLEKDRSRRYETASGLARDVERYLHDEPVEACSPSAAYRLRKFAHKYRTPVTFAAMVALLLVAGVIVSAWLAVRATRAEVEAVAQREQATGALREANMRRLEAEEARQEISRQWYAATINLMQQAWDSGQVDGLRTLLAETEEYPDRGFEWYYCQRLCHLERQTLIGHRAGVTAVSWSPDGKWLATASEDGTVKLWEPANGRERMTVRGHTSRVGAVCWSPDGKLLATGSDDGTAKVWDVANFSANSAAARELLTLKGHTNGVYSLSWSPDGKRLATASWDWTAKVWEVAGGRELLTLKGGTGRVYSVSWSPDGKRLVTGGEPLREGEGGKVTVREAVSGRALFTLDCHSLVVPVSWSPDGQLLATGNEHGTAKVWEAAGGREVLTLHGHSNRVRSVSWSPDGKLLVTGSEDGTAKLWEAASGRELITLKGHTGPVWSVAWSPDGKWLATASDDGTAKVWESVSDRQVVTLKGHYLGVYSVSWSPDAKLLATGSWHDSAKVWEAVSGRQLLTLEGQSVAAAVSWSPDGKLLALGIWNGTAQVWETASNRKLLTLEGHRGGVNSVSWSPDGKLLATASDDGRVKLWEAASGRKLLTLEGHRSGVNSVSWSPDGKRLATASDDGTAKVWAATGGQEPLTLKGHTDGVNSVSWSPDGEWLATANDDRTVKLWEAASGRERMTLKGHTRSVRSVSWSPDGKRLATGSDDTTVKVWDVAGGRQLLTLRGHTGPIWSVSWSPDGKRLATGSADETAKVWEAGGAEALQEWRRQHRVLEEHLALNDFRSPEAQGFIQNWLVLLPLPWDSGESGEQALDRQQLPDEARLKPKPGQRASLNGQELFWRDHRSPQAVMNFNAVLGHVTERSVAYAASYLESDRARNDLWLQVFSGHQAKVYINGREIHKRRPDFWSQGGLDTIGPVLLEHGTNMLLFKVVNEGGSWEGCVRLVDEAGRPAKDIRVKLTPEP